MFTITFKNSSKVETYRDRRSWAIALGYWQRRYAVDTFNNTATVYDC